MKRTWRTFGLMIGLISASASAQGDAPNLALNTPSYHTAIGLRAGGTSGVTFKQFVGGNNALEGILGMWYRGFSATLLYEKHVSAGAPGFNWYLGAGGHVAAEGQHTYYYYRGGRHLLYEPGSVGLGVDGIVGIEYWFFSNPSGPATMKAPMACAPWMWELS